MFIKIGDEIYNLNSIIRVKKQTERGKTVLILYFSASDKERQVSKRLTDSAAEEVWEMLDSKAKDLTQE